MPRIGTKHCKVGHLMDPSWKVCPVCIAPICAWLVFKNSAQKNRVFTIHEGKNKIGTGADCEIRILLDTVSRQHALLHGRNGKYNISDLSSVTGTFVNNFQISSREIIDGDIIKLGDVEFIFKCL